MEKTIYRTDRIWFNIEDKALYGDMSFSFGESDDSRCSDIETLKDKVKYSMKVDSEWSPYNADDEIAVYLIEKGTIHYESEDEISDFNGFEDFTLFDVDDWEGVYLMMYCSEEYAAQIGLIDALKDNAFRFKGEPIFCDEDC